jgi:hypothetical protein
MHRTTNIKLIPKGPGLWIYLFNWPYSSVRGYATVRLDGQANKITESKKLIVFFPKHRKTERAMQFPTQCTRIFSQIINWPKSRSSGQHTFSVFGRFMFQIWIRRESILKGDFCCFLQLIQKKGIMLRINIGALSSKIFPFIIHF